MKYIDRRIEFKKRITVSTPYSIMWWVELLMFASTRYTTSMERLQWEDAERYLALSKWLWCRLEKRIEKVSYDQRLECGKTYARFTHDSNNYTFQGNPIKNWVRDKIENTKLTTLR